MLVAVALSGEAFWTKLRELWAEGHALMPLDASASREQAQRLLSRMRPHMLIDSSGASVLASPAEIASGTAFVVPTSGTSGRPKGVVLSREAVQHSARAGMRRLGCAPDERWLVCLPLHHIAGLMMLVRSMLSGSSPVIHAGFDVEAIRAEKTTTLTALVPTALKRLLDAGVDLSGYTAVRVGGAALPPALSAQARAKNVRLVNGYGMTETCGGCVYDGVPLEDMQVRLGLQDEVLLRGPVLMDGYRLEEELTRRALHNGWLHTGDRGRFGERGNLEVLGRLDDLIISGGENIDAAQVEKILMHHPSVGDCAVVGLPDDEWGEVVAAAIVAEGDPPGLVEIRDFVGNRASRQIAPRRLTIVSSIPRAATGKVLRAEVTALFRQ